MYFSTEQTKLYMRTIRIAYISHGLGHFLGENHECTNLKFDNPRAEFFRRGPAH